MTTNPSTGAPVSVEPAPAGAGAPSHKYTVEKITDPNAPPLLYGKWHVLRDGAHMATANTRGGALRLKRNYETLQAMRRK